MRERPLVRLLGTSDADLDAAAAILRGGGVVAFPTETVYGLGANAFDAVAVARIFEIKARPSFDPLIVHVAGVAMLGEVTAGLTEREAALAAAFWPGPLTIVTRKSARIPDIVTSGLPTVGVRMPAHPVARALLMRVGLPLAAPSANPFGYLSPTRAAHVAASLGERADAIVDGGAAQHGLESTIVAVEPVPSLLRHGAIPAADIERLTGPLEVRTAHQAAIAAPGQLEQHYSPHTPIRIVDPATVAPVQREGAAMLAFQRAADGYAHVRILSPRGDLRDAAARLFEALHELDALGATRIDAETVPDEGLGKAINDRLRRAAAKT